MLSHSIMSDCLWPHTLQPDRLICLCNFPGKNSRMGYLFLLQGICLTQGSNPQSLAPPALARFLNSRATWNTKTLCGPRILGRWTLLPPPSLYHPSGSSQCTSPKHPVSCIEPGLGTRFIYDIIHISMPFSQIIPPSPSPTESKRLFYRSVSLLLSCIQGYCYHLSKFHIYALVYCIGVFLSGLLHSV